MARNGSGTYSLPSGNPVVGGTTISSTWANTTLSDIANELTNSMARDGQSPPTANLPMGGYKLTGLANGSAATDSATVDNVNKYALNQGASDPGAIGAYALWADSGNSLIKQRNAANTGWITIGSLLKSFSDSSYESHASAAITLASTATMVKADTVDAQRGSSYSGTTGLYTAPVDGLYTFSAVAVISSPKARNLYAMSIYRNSTSMINQSISADSTSLRSLAASITLWLTAGDTVSVYGYYNDGGGGSVGNQFSTLKFYGAFIR